MRRTLALIVFAILLTGGAEGALAQEPTDDSDRIQSLVQPSIVYLETTFSGVVRDTNPRSPEIMFGGDPVAVGSRCTGFFVNPEGYVATAAHCILPDEAGNDPGGTRRSIIDEAGIRAFREGVFNEDATEEGAIGYARDWFRIVGKIAVASAVAYPTDSTQVSSEETTAARRVGYRSFPDGDIGLLKFETSGVAMPGLELAEDDEVRSQTPIFAVGFPGSVDDVTDQDYNPTFSSGAIQRYGTREGRAVPVYQHGAEVSGGMSGGPVVDVDGRVIGVTSFGRAGETASFNFASPVALLREVLGDKGVENDVGSVGRIYREGVEALYNEEKDTALDRFSDVLQNYPGNPARSLASSLRLRAEELPDEGFSLWLLALILLGVLALAGGAVYLLRRRTATPAFAGVPSSLESSPRPQSIPATPPHRAADTATGNGGPAVLVVGPRGETAVRYALDGEMLVGREAVDILLADEQVSRKHAQLTVKDDGRVELADLGSANGTEVNGKRINGPVTLKHGDTITLGSTELKVELPKARGAIPSGETVIGS